jgi:hypothetical protein
VSTRLRDLATAWRATAVNLCRYGAEQDCPLTLAAAAAESGLSVDHLGKLIRDGTIPNAGRKGAPRIRSADVPRGAKRVVAGSGARVYDAAADARSLASLHRGGAHGGTH